MPKRKRNNDPFGGFGDFDFGNFRSTDFDFDIFGSKNSGTRKRTKSALNMGMNKEWGKVIENFDAIDSITSGYETERTGRGSDFRRRRPNEKKWTYTEVKSGKSPLSPLQKKEKKKRGRRYEVHRYGSNPFRF